MRILFFTENYPPEVNAAASRVHERARLWARAGHEVTVITCAPNFPQGRVHAGYRNRPRQVETIEGVRVVRVWSFMARNEGLALRMLDFLSFMVTGFLGGMAERRPDIVTSTSPQFFAAVAAWACAALRRRPYVFELGDLWPASITALGAMRRSWAIRRMEALELFLYRRAAAVIALTEDFERDLVSRGIPAGKIVVVRNGVDLDRYAPRARDAALARAHALEDRFVVAYIGTHGLAHALDKVLDAAALVAREEPGVRFVFVGDGAAREGLAGEAARRGLGNVAFLGPRPKEEMPRWWSLADAGLVSLRDIALFEGVIPSKVFEAMGMGVPVIFSGPRGEASAIVEEAGCGLLVPPETPRALADAVLALARDRTLRARLAEAARAAAPRHSRVRQAERVLGVYRAVLEER